VILGAALAQPSYISYEIFHSITKHRFLCNIISGSNAFFPGNTSLQYIAGTTRPLGYCPEGPIADDWNNYLPTTSSLPAIPLLIYNDLDSKVFFLYTLL